MVITSWGNPTNLCHRMSALLTRKHWVLPVHNTTQRMPTQPALKLMHVMKLICKEPKRMTIATLGSWWTTRTRLAAIWSFKPTSCSKWESKMTLMKSFKTYWAAKPFHSRSKKTMTPKVFPTAPLPTLIHNSLKTKWLREILWKS